ncbi:uncharacterized protein JCM15063_001521 [Sporobolomyces koalae]|uniref:uncharacterized protein n=1 Tax=Sporobolomyces koalae TaxID=500713 RepID=UPI00317D8578
MDSAPVPNVAFAGSACLQCFKPSTVVTLRKCSSCRIVKYCSTECSTRDWKDHKSFCVSIKAIRTSPTAPSPPPPLSTSQSSSLETTHLARRRVLQRKLWLTEDELLETALKRPATMLESKLLWREPRCFVCWDRECDVERRPVPNEPKIQEIVHEEQDANRWRLCSGCRVIGFCGQAHEDFARQQHRHVRDVEGRTHCETIQLSNEIDEYRLRRHLAHANLASPPPPPLWVPNRTLTTIAPLERNWTEYLDSVKQYLPTPIPPLAEIYGVFLEALSPVMTLVAALTKLGFVTNDHESNSKTTLTIYLVDESLETCQSWIPCFEELQHRLPHVQHLNLVTISPKQDSATAKLDHKVTTLPMCPTCVSQNRSRTIRHVHELSSTTEFSNASSSSLLVSFNTSIALSLENPNSFWSTFVRSIPNKVPFVLTSQTREEGQDAIEALVSLEHPVSPIWAVEPNVWKGGWDRVEGWWGIDTVDGLEGEGLVAKNKWWYAVHRK